MKQRIYSLDILRIIATFAILLFHWNAYCVQFGIDTVPVLNLPLATGTIAVPAVSFFFILSGASLMLSSRRRFSLANYYKKRFLSIYPLFYLSYGMVFILTYVVHRRPFDRPLATLPLTLLGLDGLLVDVFDTWYLIGEWFIGCIVCLYLIFPFLRLAVRRAPGLTLAGALLFALANARFYPLAFDITHFPLSRAPEMIFGMVYAEVFYPEGSSSSPFIGGLSSFFGASANAPARASYPARRLLLAAMALAAGLFPAFVHLELPETLLALLQGCGLFTGLELLLSLLLPKNRKLPLLAEASGMTYGVFLIHHVFVGEFLGPYLGASLPQGRNILLFLGCLVTVSVLGTLLTLAVQKAPVFLKNAFFQSSSTSSTPRP